MSNLINFNFENSPIRVFEKQGEPWFVANDVCDVLGLTNPRQALTALDDDEKGVILTDTLGGEQKNQHYQRKRVIYFNFAFSQSHPTRHCSAQI